MDQGFADIHAHLLYGIDDGPADRDGMYAMLDSAAAQGIRSIVATPHATPGVYSFDITEYRRLLAEAQAYCAKKLPGLKVYGGAEIFYTEHACRLLTAGEIPLMAGTDCVLVEFSPDVRCEALYEALSKLTACGFRPILAHAERYRCLTVWPARAERLKRELDVYIQINCSGVLGKGRFSARVFSEWMLERRLVDAIASDAHGTEFRPNRLGEAYAAAAEKYGAEYAGYLVSGGILGV